MGIEVSRVLVTGALGQIGSELTPKLKQVYGRENVVASDIRMPDDDYSVVFEILDVTKPEDIEKIVKEYEIDTIVHLAAILSATGERNPDLAWQINVEGLKNILNVARDLDLTRVFNPSSIAAFGPETPRDQTPQNTIQRPKTIYGISKVVGELLGNYYFEKYGVDVRGARLPGVISNVAPPGGGTTDYAVEIFYEAIKDKKYTCFLRDDTVLPMIYMPDCLNAFIKLLNAELADLTHHCDYNLAAISFSPSDLVSEIKVHIPEFEIVYKPDYRQAIADSWPRSIDDSISREDWGWEPAYDLPKMVADMYRVLVKRYVNGEL